MTTEDIFEEIVSDETTETNEALTLDHFVGEGKKYRDNNAVAKALAEKDRYIAQIQNENKGFREELAKRAGIEDLMNKLEERKNAKQEVPTMEQNPQPKETNPADIEALLEAKLAEREARSEAQRNLQASMEAVVTLWGADSQLNLNRKAKELGMSLDSLKKIASENPNLFLSALGVTAKIKQPSFSGSPVDTTRNPNVGSDTKNKAYYDNIRKSNKALYFSPALQAEMFEQARKQGAAFYQ